MRARRAFLGLTEIAGYYGRLADGLRANGVDAVACDLSGNPYGYVTATGPLMVRVAEFCARRNARSPRRSPLKPLWKAVAVSIRLPLFAWAVARHDLFVFGFGTSFFGQRELPLLKRLGKSVVHVFHGSDSRPPYLDGSLMDGRTAAECIELTRAVELRLRKIEAHADVIVSNPLSSQLHRRPFVSFLALGVPHSGVRPSADDTSRPPVRALHAPSHPRAKGTPEIRAAVERVNARGVELRLVEVTGQPNETVLAELRANHFVVDQIYADVAMAGFVVEAACAGRAALVAGYGRDALGDAMCGRPFPPVHFCHPDEVDDALERLATDEGYRVELGASARAFVADEWAPEEVARRLLDALGGDTSLVVDPATITYAEGGGLSRARLGALLHEVVALGGVEALRVADKPELEQRLLALAGGE